MRNENLHQVIVCTTEAKRLAVMDVETKPGDRWNEHCAVVFGKWILENREYKALSAHASNGNFTVWVTRLQ